VSYRSLWVKHNGPIPVDSDGRAYEIHHINGDKYDNRIENLMCVPIREHYDIHYSQGDWAACLRISTRMDISPEEKSQLASKQQLSRIESGEHHFLHNKTTGMVVAKDQHGNTLQVSQADPRWTSGELVGIMKGVGTGRPKGSKDLKPRKTRTQMKVNYKGAIYENAKVASKEVGLSLNRVRHNCVKEMLGWSWVR
jgi:hypothetical protein